MDLREELLAKAEARSKQALIAARFQTLGPPEPERLFVEEETSIDTREAPEDPEIVEALARVKVLEFTKSELQTIKTLSANAITTVLTNGSAKEKISAAKLAILMTQIEATNYRELRKQRLDSLPKRRRVAFQLNPEHFTRMQQDIERNLNAES